MGEAKRKRTTTAKFLEKHPKCCFCGGEKDATTRDHVPPIAVFTNRQRPDGLVFPACYDCNQSSKKDEYVATMMSRLYPDAKTHLGRAETIKIMGRVDKENPGLFLELQANSSQQEKFEIHRPKGLVGGGPLNASGPLLNRSMQTFGAKLGKALHYEFTAKPVPKTGGVAVRWYSNYDLFTGDIPRDLIDYLGEPTTLQQGKWSVKEQFSYAGRIVATGEAGMYAAAFRKSFFVVAFVQHDAQGFPLIEDMTIHRP